MATTNPFDGLPYPPNAPYVHAAAITPSDTADLTTPTRAIWVGTGGAVDLKVIMAGGETVTFKNVASGTELRISATRVLLTGTGVTNIVGVW